MTWDLGNLRYLVRIVPQTKGILRPLWMVTMEKLNRQFIGRMYLTWSQIVLQGSP